MNTSDLSVDWLVVAATMHVLMFDVENPPPPHSLRQSIRMMVKLT